MEKKKEYTKNQVEIYYGLIKESKPGDPQSVKLSDKDYKILAACFQDEFYYLLVQDIETMEVKNITLKPS